MEFSSVFNGAEQKPEIGPEKPEQNDADRMACLFSCKMYGLLLWSPPTQGEMWCGGQTGMPHGAEQPLLSH